VTDGVLPTTRILYPVPVLVPLGSVAEMVPAVVCVSVPILVGLEKLPDELESCAVNTFPDVKVPLIVKGTDTEAPEQKGEPEIEDVVIAAAVDAVTEKVEELRTLTVPARGSRYK
jgi:hypothetical protein